MKFFPPDKDASTVAIPVKVVKGKITYFYGGRMPKLKEGAIGDLILPAFAVLDENWVTTLNESQTVRLLEVGQVLFLAMRQERIPTHLRDQTLTPEHLPFGDLRDEWHDRFIPVTLTEPLDLILRGTKKAILSGGGCHIPTLNLDAISLNHAYTLVSAVYEPERRSHTGNVFQRAYYRSSPTGKSWPLGILRGTHEAEYEEKRLLSKKQRAEKEKRTQEAKQRSEGRQVKPSDADSDPAAPRSLGQAMLMLDLPL